MKKINRYISCFLVLPVSKVNLIPSLQVYLISDPKKICIPVKHEHSTSQQYKSFSIIVMREREVRFHAKTTNLNPLLFSVNNGNSIRAEVYMCSLQPS